MKSKTECAACANRAVQYDLAVSSFQTVFKLAFAQLTGSVSLGISSLVSLGDFITKLITLVSIKISRLPPSTRFPYGYGKIQFLSAMIIGLALNAGAIAILIRNLWVVEEAHSVPPSLIALVAVVFSAAISQVMFRYLNCVGTKNKNAGILAAALDNRLDFISGVVVFTGITLSHLGWEDADYWTAVLVSLLVMYVGSKIFYDALISLLDISVPEEIVEEINKITRRTSGVVKVEYCRARSLGETWELNMQVAIDQDLSTKEVQSLNDSLRAKILHFEPSFAFIQISNRAVKKVVHSDEGDIFKLFKESHD